MILVPNEVYDSLISLNVEMDLERSLVMLQARSRGLPGTLKEKPGSQLLEQSEVTSGRMRPERCWWTQSLVSHCKGFGFALSELGHVWRISRRRLSLCDLGFNKTTLAVENTV